MAVDGMVQEQVRAIQQVGAQLVPEFKSAEQQAVDIERQRQALEVRRMQESLNAQQLVSDLGGAAWNILQCAVAASLIIGAGYGVWWAGSKMVGGSR